MAKQERKVKELLARLPVGFAPFFKQVKRFTEFLKSKFYKHRVSFLTLFVILGLWLSYFLITRQACSDIDFWEAMEILITKRNWLISSLILGFVVETSNSNLGLKNEKHVHFYEL